MLVVFLVVLSGCSKKMLPGINTVTKDSVTTIIKYVPKDSLIFLPGDTVEISEVIPCPDVEWQQTNTSESGKTKVTAKISKGVLTVNCATDSLQKRITWLEKELSTTRAKETTTTITLPPKRYIPKWVWWMLAGFTGLLVYTFRNPLIGIATKLFRK